MGVNISSDRYLIDGWQIDAASWECKARAHHRQDARKGKTRFARSLRRPHCPFQEVVADPRS
jgi:hypothetical protein